MIKTTKKAFTLVELIVVIVILAVLATIAFITLQDYPKDARDSERKTEVAGIFNKINILNAKDPTNKYSTMVKDAGTKDSNDVITGDVDLTKVGEGDEFKDPDGSDYKIQYKLDGTVESCFAISAKSEKTETYDIVRSNCTPALDLVNP